MRSIRSKAWQRSTSCWEPWRCCSLPRLPIPANGSSSLNARAIFARWYRRTDRAQWLLLQRLGDELGVGATVLVPTLPATEATEASLWDALNGKTIAFTRFASQPFGVRKNSWRRWRPQCESSCFPTTCGRFACVPYSRRDSVSVRARHRSRDARGRRFHSRATLPGTPDRVCARPREHRSPHRRAESS